MRRNNFYHLLLVWLLAAPAVLPLAHPTLTHSADGLLHLYRVMALAQAMAQGHLLPRWLPDLAYGYGFPLFVFYAPLSYSITALLNFIPGLTAAAAFNLSLGLATLLAASGLYLFTKALFGPKAGILAAVAYVYAPFQLYNTLFRGSLPAAWAMALFPFVFWSFTRLLQSPNRRDTALAAITLGAALLTHNTLSLLFVPLLALYLPLYWWQTGRSLRSGALALAALALGAGLAAFFLLPALVEKQFAQVERVIISPDFNFRFNFVSLAQLFSLPAPANTGLLNPPAPLTLGLAQFALALAGLVAGAAALYKKRLPAAAALTAVLFGGLVLAGAISMMLPASQPVWERLPLLAFIQFPHRLLGPAALAIALLGGLAVAAAPGRAGSWLTLAGAGLIVMAAAPLLYPRYRTDLPPAPSTPDMFAYEHRTGAIGTTSFGEYLPSWVAQTPPNSPLEAQYGQGRAIDRLARDYLPAGAVVHAVTPGFNRLDADIWSPVAFRAVVNAFYFPGWQAQIDGQPAAAHPFSERGLIAVEMPAGRHTLRLEFTETPLRRTANWLSLAALALLAGLALAGPATPAAKTSPAGAFASAQLLALAMLAVLLIGLKLAYLDRFSSPLKIQFDGVNVAQAGVARQVNFGDQINLLGYTLAAPAARPGDTFQLTLFWQARQPLGVDYSALAQLVDDAGNLYAGQDNLHPGGLPGSQWQPWGFVRDEHNVPLPPGTPPGDYWLVTGLYNPANWARLPVLAGGDPGRADVIAVPVTVEPALRRPTLPELGIAWPVTAEFGSLRLLGATPERVVIVPNDFVRIAVFWEAVSAPVEDSRIALQLVDAAGQMALQSEQQPSHNRYPTTRWSTGERVRDNHALWVPADFPPGDYAVRVTVLTPAGQPANLWVELGTLPLPK